MRQLILSVVITFVLASADPVSAGLNRWTNSGLAGASITALVAEPGSIDDFAPPELIYAATDGGGVWRSDTIGEPQWRRVGADLPETVITALALDSRTPRLYAGTASGRIFGSIDRGETWTEVDKPASGAIRSIATHTFNARDTRADRIYAATDTGVVVGAVGGGAWRVVPELAGRAVSVAVARNGFAYASVAVRQLPGNTSRTDVYVSTDGGERWRPTNLGVGVLPVLAANPQNNTIHASLPGGAAVTADNGASWQFLPVLAAPVRALLALDTRLYAGTDAGVFSYDAREKAWRRIGAFAERVTAMTFLLDSLRPLYVGTRTGVFREVEGHSDFRAASNGLDVPTVFDLATSGGDTAHAATAGGLFRTADGGASWQKVAGVEQPSQVAANGRSAVYANSTRGLQRSGDDGLTWDGVSSVRAISLAVSRSSPEAVYAGFADTLSKSTDGGRTFNRAAVGLENWFYYGFSGNIETDDEEPSTAYYSSGDDLLQTVNGGQSWIPLLAGTPGSIGMRDRVVAARGLLIHASVHHGGIITSTDRGKTWSAARLADERVQAIAIDPVVPGRSYAGSASGNVYRSDDSGQHWTLFGEGLQRSAIQRLATDESGRRIYAATAGGLFTYEINSTFARLLGDSLRLPQLIRALLALPDPLPTGLSSGFVLPAAGTIAGARGNKFRTEMTLSNRRSTGQEILLAWLPQGNGSGPAVAMFRATLPPSSEEGGGTLFTGDIAADLALEGLGSLLVIAVTAGGEADRAADIDGFSRIHSPSSCGSGSVSQSLAAIPSQAFATGRRARALGLRHDSGYRTNVGIVNLGETTRQFTVVVDGERHVERFSISVPPFTPVQAAVPDRNYGAVAVTVIGDGGTAPWVAYGSSVDNASGDAWASAAKQLRDR